MPWEMPCWIMTFFSCLTRVYCDYSYVARYLFLFQRARNTNQNISNQYHCSCSWSRWKLQVLIPLSILLFSNQPGSKLSDKKRLTGLHPKSKSEYEHAPFFDIAWPSSLLIITAIWELVSAFSNLLPLILRMTNCGMWMQ